MLYIGFDENYLQEIIFFLIFVILFFYLKITNKSIKHIKDNKIF